MTTAELWAEYNASPTIENRNRLVEAYMPLVRITAARMRSRLPWSVETDDLVSAGVFGLVDAIERYDQARGTSFPTFAKPRIRGAMQDELRAVDPAKRAMRRAEKLGATIPCQISLDTAKVRERPDRHDNDVAAAIQADNVWAMVDRGQQRLRLSRIFRDGATQLQVSREMGLSESSVSLMVTARLADLRAALAGRRGEFVREDRGHRERRCQRLTDDWVD